MLIKLPSRSNLMSQNQHTVPETVINVFSASHCDERPVNDIKQFISTSTYPSKDFGYAIYLSIYI